MTMSLAREVEVELPVNAIAPGFIKNSNDGCFTR